MTLDELPQGKSATLTVIGGEGELRQHFLVSAVADFDLRIVLPEFGQDFDDVGT